MPDSSLEGLKLLVAEDDPLLGLLIAELLEDEGAVVTGPWPTAQLAAEALRNSAPVAALLDIELLDGDSFGIAMALEKKSVPCAFVSASDPRHVPGSLKPSAFLAKPASLKDLIRIVRLLQMACQKSPSDKRC